MTNKIERMTALMKLFHEKDFQFDIHHAYFTRTNKLLKSHQFSALSDEFKNAFAAAERGDDGRKELARIWCNWLA